MKFSNAIVLAALLGLLTSFSACSSGGNSAEDRDGNIAKCEMRALRQTNDAALASGFCGCLIDGLSAEGFSIIDTLNPINPRPREISQSCASQYGMQAPE